MNLRRVVSWLLQRQPSTRRDPPRALIYRGIVLEFLVAMAVHLQIYARYNLAAFYYEDCRSAWWPILGESLIPALVISVFINLLILRPAIRCPEQGFWRQLIPAVLWSVVGGGLGGIVWDGFYYTISSRICTFWPGYTTNFFQIGIVLGLGFGLSALFSAHSGRNRRQHTFRFARRVIYLLIPPMLLLIWFGAALSQGLNMGVATLPQLALSALGFLFMIYIMLVIAVGSVWLADYWGRESGQ